MDVTSVPGDAERPRARTAGASSTRSRSPPTRGATATIVRGSRGEFTVAKDVNVRLRSGWFSDRAACYLAAGRPVVEQDTGFGDVLPLRPRPARLPHRGGGGRRRSAPIEADYPRASAHATEVAREYFAAESRPSRPAPRRRDL